MPARKHAKPRDDHHPHEAQQLRELQKQAHEEHEAIDTDSGDADGAAETSAAAAPPANGTAQRFEPRVIKTAGPPPPTIAYDQSTLPDPSTYESMQETIPFSWTTLSFYWELLQDACDANGDIDKARILNSPSVTPDIRPFVERSMRMGKGQLLTLSIYDTMKVRFFWVLREEIDYENSKNGVTVIKRGKPDMVPHYPVNGVWRQVHAIRFPPMTMDQSTNLLHGDHPDAEMKEKIDRLRARTRLPVSDKNHLPMTAFASKAKTISEQVYNNKELPNEYRVNMHFYPTFNARDYAAPIFIAFLLQLRLEQQLYLDAAPYPPFMADLRRTKKTKVMTLADGRVWNAFAAFRESSNHAIKYGDLKNMEKRDDASVFATPSDAFKPYFVTKCEGDKTRLNSFLTVTRRPFWAQTITFGDEEALAKRKMWFEKHPATTEATPEKMLWQHKLDGFLDPQGIIANMCKAVVRNEKMMPPLTVKKPNLFELAPVCVSGSGGGMLRDETGNLVVAKRRLTNAEVQDITHTKYRVIVIMPKVQLDYGTNGDIQWFAHRWVSGLLVSKLEWKTAESEEEYLDKAAESYAPKRTKWTLPAAAIGAVQMPATEPSGDGEFGDADEAIAKMDMPPAA